MTDEQLQDLRDELDGDPIGRGYAGMDDVQAADSLNTVDRQPNRESLSGGMLVASIVRAEYTALSAADKDYVRLVALADEIPLTATIKTELGAVFPPASQTRANMLALLKRPGSRAEEIGLPTVTPSDVANARRLP